MFLGVWNHPATPWTTTDWFVSSGNSFSNCQNTFSLLHLPWLKKKNHIISLFFKETLFGGVSYFFVKPSLKCLLEFLKNKYYFYKAISILLWYLSFIFSFRCYWDISSYLSEESLIMILFVSQKPLLLNILSLDFF